MNVIIGGVTSPKGYSAVGGFIGIKKAKKDLALIVSENDAVCAASFTTNRVKAAPVLWDEANYKNPIRGIIVSSGNANACTGEQGFADTQAMAEALAALAGVQSKNILVCSTGVIGVPLPMDVIIPGIKSMFLNIAATASAGNDAAEAICTTDTFSKQVAVEFELDGKIITIGGMAKGSGMIHPNMATMLSFVTTDANISAELLQRVLTESVQDSYNMISVDGDTSTNDTVLVLANGSAGNSEIRDLGESYEIFKQALCYVNEKLAKDVVYDGEGATKFIEMNVSGAKSRTDARLLCKSVISSSLVKTAFFGSDANWGRVLCAMGYSGADFSTDDVSLTFSSSAGKVILMKDGKPVTFDEDYAKEILKQREIKINAVIKGGDFSATAWGTDLSYDYVKINGDYRS